MSIEQKIDSVVKKYKLKKIALDQICKYFQEYHERSTIFEITEGYMENREGINAYIRDALTDNAFLDDDEKKYDLYILQIRDDRLISTFYREEYGNEMNIIHEFEAIKNET